MVCISKPNTPHNFRAIFVDPVLNAPEGVQCSRLQLPLKLAWAVTIHKSQGLTLDKVVINVGKREFSTGLTFVACSRVRQLKDLLFSPPFPFQRLANLANSQRLQERKEEDVKLLSLCFPPRTGHNTHLPQ